MKGLEKLEKWGFYLLIILLPTQFGPHFWPSWAFVNGVRVDYFSPTLYLTDLLILALFLLEIFNFQFSIFNKLSIKKFLNYKVYWVIGLLVLLALLNIQTSLSPFISFYKWIKVAEFGFLAWWVARNFKFQISNFKLLAIPVFYESILAVWQFLAQSSIGGLWYFLGERTFNAATPGIANAYITGSLVLRPYGTFPHPNVLGGFLGVVLPLFLARFLQKYRKINARNLRLVTGHWSLMILALGYVALGLSLSRSAIVVGVVASLVVIFLSWRKLEMPKLLGVLGLLGALGVAITLWPRFAALVVENEPIFYREQSAARAVQEFVRSPLLGTGLGTSPLYSQIPNTKYKIQNHALLYQPVHNIYLLLLAETGIVGFGFFVALVFFCIRCCLLTANRYTLTAFISILVLGLFDHYFLTLQQGQLVLALVVGAGVSKVKFS